MPGGGARELRQGGVTCRPAPAQRGAALRVSRFHVVRKQCFDIARKRCFDVAKKRSFNDSRKRCFDVARNDVLMAQNTVLCVARK